MAAFLYSIIVWPVIWAPTEDNTYAGYSLPRVEALTGRKWLAVVVVGFFWALQHVFLPFRLEWQWLVSHFVGFVPVAVVYCLLYLRWRRLLPVHVIHWFGNVASVLMIAIGSAAGV